MKRGYVSKVKSLLLLMLEEKNVLLVTIAALSASRLIHQSLKFLLNNSFIDLAYHYFYSTMIRLDLNPFDQASIEVARNIVSIRYAGGQAVYPPSYFFFFQSLTYIPFSTLATLWLCFSLFLVFLSINILAKNIKWNKSLINFTFIIVIIGNYQPLYEDLALGQNNCVILFFAVAAWHGIRNKNDFISGISIAIMAFIKIQYGLLFLYFIIEGKKHVIWISIISFLSLEFAGLTQLDLGFYKNYINALLHHTSKVSTDIHNISFNGQLNYFFNNSHNQAILAYVAMFIFFIFVTYYIIFRHKKYVPSEFSFLVWLTLVPLLSPHTEEHHLVVLLLPIIWISLNINHANLVVKSFLFLAAIILVSRYSIAQYALNSWIWLYPLLCLKSVGTLLLLLALICYSITEYNIKKQDVSYIPV